MPRLVSVTGWALLVLAGAFLLTDALLWRPGVTEANARRIRVGMTLEEVGRSKECCPAARGRGHRPPRRGTAAYPRSSLRCRRPDADPLDHQPPLYRAHRQADGHPGP